MIGSQRSGVFLSYARADGEEFAESLRDRIRKQAPDIEIKQDRLLLEGGVGWWKQLQQAIDSVEFLVLVMTPSAVQSAMVRREWRYARQQGVCVYPVKAAPDSQLQFSQLPRWMSKAHFFDLEKEWESFAAHLRKGCDTPRVPFMSPELPETFIQRPEEFGRLKNLLLSPDRNQPVAITTALIGAGGFGKTTLAAALCHDEDIIQNFDDGILWVTLGQSPNVLGSLVTVYAALTGERPGFATEGDAAFQLCQKLEDRTCLLIIDDVWDDAHLRPFLRGGKGCTRLFTTRNAEIAANAQRVSVDEMRESESIALLTAGVPGVNPSRARELSRKLGEWAFALELARAMMRQRIDQGDSAEHAADRLLQILNRKGPRGLTKGTGDPRHRTIDGVLEGSLELLNDDDRRRLTELSIFPEDVAIPLREAGELWGLDEFDAEETAQRFARLHLLKLDLARGAMRLHDVMRSWLGADVGNAPKLHSRLVDAWPDWLQLPDAYAWRWMTWHLAEAGRSTDVERILWDPAWLRAKLAAGDVNSLISDFDRLKPLRQVGLLQGAIRLSSHILAKDPRQFDSQMVGRLLRHADKPAILQFIDSLIRSARRPWLRPLYAALDPPGTALVRTLIGHSNTVNAVALSPDGRRAVSASDDKTLRVWDLETGAELRTLVGHSRAVTSVALSPDGRQAVSASADGTLKVWDLETGAKLRTLLGHSSYVTCLARSPDGRRAVSASKDQTLILWDLETGSELRSLNIGTSNLRAVALSPDGRRVVSVSGVGALMIWDLETGEEMRTVVAHSKSVNGVALSPDGRYAVSASRDHRLEVWDLETGTRLRALAGHSSDMAGIALSRGGRRAISASADKTLIVWDLETGAKLRTLVNHSHGIAAVWLSDDGRLAVSGSKDGTLKVWDLETGADPKTLADRPEWVRRLALSADGRRAVSVSWDGLKVWDKETGSELLALSARSDWVNSLALTPDGRRAVSVTAGNTLRVWDLETGAELRTLTAVDCEAVSFVGWRVVSASRDGVLTIWDLEPNAGMMRMLVNHSQSAHAVAMSQDGRRALSSSDDETLTVWDLETGSELRTIVVHSDSADALAMSPDGRRAVSASRHGTIITWDLESGAALRRLVSYSDTAAGVALSPDGLWAVSASQDRTIKVLDLGAGAISASFSCDAHVECFAIANRTIVVGDDAGLLHWLSLET